MTGRIYSFNIYITLIFNFLRWLKPNKYPRINRIFFSFSLKILTEMEHKCSICLLAVKNAREVYVHLASVHYSIEPEKMFVSLKKYFLSDTFLFSDSLNCFKLTQRV